MRKTTGPPSPHGAAPTTSRRVVAGMPCAARDQTLSTSRLRPDKPGPAPKPASLRYRLRGRPYYSFERPRRRKGRIGKYDLSGKADRQHSKSGSRSKRGGSASSWPASPPPRRPTASTLSRAGWKRASPANMDYLHRHADARRHPHSILPGVRSVVMVGMNYKPGRDLHCTRAATAPRRAVTRAAGTTTMFSASG